MDKESGPHPHGEVGEKRVGLGGEWRVRVREEG